MDDLLRTADTLARQLAATAVERDRAGGHAAAERELNRASGLLALTIPVEHGGLGADWPTFYATLRRLAQADSALAHLYGFHHLQMATLLLYGTAEQQRRHFGETVTQRLFWGNALNPLDPQRPGSVDKHGNPNLVTPDNSPVVGSGVPGGGLRRRARANRRSCPRPASSPRATGKP